MSTQTQVEIGSDFLGYRIEELVGRGGMGVVYRAYDLRLKRALALKLVTPELALDERFKERFARETELTMALEHPNVVPIHDAGDADGRLYLAMRLVEGTDLRALLAREGALEPARALAICGQVANALDAAHSKGLVHRDVKPSNVLLDANEHVYLADFGLTRRLEEQGAQAGEGRSVGTPAYLAPELIEGESVDGRVDVYSLGCLLFECLTGRPPYQGDSRLAVAWAHLEEDPPRASVLGADLPEPLDAVIRKALAKEPDKRYPTCGALIGAAGRALGLRQRRPSVRRTALLVVATTVAVALAASLVALLFTRGDEARTVPEVRANSLVSIDPMTNAVSAVTDVGEKPMAVAAGGSSVWVYNDLDDTVSEVDAETNEVRQTTDVSARPVDLSLSAGPVMAADEGGAWIVGVDGNSRPVLTRAFSGVREAHDFLLDREPRAVAAGAGAVWVLVAGKRDFQVLRVDPATGEVTARTRFPASSRVTSLDVGLGAVWVMSSPSATLYRINPRSAAVTGRTDLGRRAGRPKVLFGRIWVAVSYPSARDPRMAPVGSPGGRTVLVDPRTLRVDAVLAIGYTDTQEDVDAFGWDWTSDWPSGRVLKWNPATFQPVGTVAVTDPPLYGGLCLTSIAAGARAVWVTLAPSRPTCRR